MGVAATENSVLPCVHVTDPHEAEVALLSDQPVTLFASVYVPGDVCSNPELRQGETWPTIGAVSKIGMISRQKSRILQVRPGNYRFLKLCSSKTKNQ